jgi:hypothetical protein
MDLNLISPGAAKGRVEALQPIRKIRRSGGKAASTPYPSGPPSPDVLRRPDRGARQAVMSVASHSCAPDALKIAHPAHN